MALSESATVRKLPSGGFQTGTVDIGEANRVRVRLESSPASPELKPSDLIEVVSAGTIYLGTVLAAQDGELVVSVEHSIDRAALAGIQQVWYRPERR